MSSSLSSLSSSDAPFTLDWILDVRAAVDVALGTTTVSVRECAAYRIGSVIRLRQPAGTDLELRMGGRPFATGEVLVADDALSVRINRILPPAGGDKA